MLAMMVASSSAMQCAGGLLRTTPPSCARAVAPAMDETMFEKALAGELEDEGLENPYMSEVGWASFLDKEGQQSYNLNERPSKAQDGYFTPDIFSNPLSILESWKDSMLRVSNDPLESSFMTISNDQSGARSYGPGKQEKDARTIKPKPKKLEDVKEYSKMRVKNIPGCASAVVSIPRVGLCLSQPYSTICCLMLTRRSLARHFSPQITSLARPAANPRAFPRSLASLRPLRIPRRRPKRDLASSSRLPASLVASENRD